MYCVLSLYMYLQRAFQNYVSSGDEYLFSLLFFSKLNCVFIALAESMSWPVEVWWMKFNKLSLKR